MSDETDWTFGGDWEIESKHSWPESYIEHESPYNYLVQVTKQVYVIKVSATVVKGYIEIFLGDQMILKVDETSDYVSIFEPETIGEVEFTMKWSDECEMQIHNCEVVPLEKDDSIIN